MLSETDLQLHELLSEINLLYLDVIKHVLSRHGMRRVRYYTMRQLALQPKLSLGRLSNLTLVELASLSRMVYSMEKEGLVIREPNEKDRRLFLLSLTGEGQSLYERVQADIEANIHTLFAALDDQTKETYLELNLRFRSILAEHIQGMSPKVSQ